MSKHDAIDGGRSAGSGASALGLTSVVLFTANAYRFGGGAFVIAYFVSMCAIGLPVLLLTFGARPVANGPVAQPSSTLFSFASWLARVCVLLVGACFAVAASWSLRMAPQAIASFAHGAADAVVTGVPRVTGSFPAHDLSGSPRAMLAVLVVWLAAGAGLFASRALARSAGRILSVFLWLAVVAVAALALSLPGGLHGLYYLATPASGTLLAPAVWTAALAQTFFTITMLYAAGRDPRSARFRRDMDIASPREGRSARWSSRHRGRMTIERPSSDAAGVTAIVLSVFMHLTFETVAATAFFALLFALAVIPADSMLTLPFLIVQHALTLSSPAVRALGLALLVLLGLAGLRSVMATAGLMSRALADRPATGRVRAIAYSTLAGLAISYALVLPFGTEAVGAEDVLMSARIVDLALEWIFEYALLLAALAHCVALAWRIGAVRVRHRLNASGPFHFGPFFDRWLRWVVPACVTSGLALTLGAGVRAAMSLETSAVLGLVFFGATTAAAAWLARLERSRAKIDSRPDVPTPPARSPRHSELVPAALQAFGMESSPHEDRQLISREREPENPAHVVDREAPCEDHAHVARAGAILLALVALLSWPAHATAQIDLDREIIRSGDFVEIDPPMGADSMRMTYRPGTAFEKTATIATRGGPFVWEAELSGVYLLTADDGTERAVVVRFRHAPLAGMLVFAGVLALLTIALTGTLAVSRRVARVDTTALWKGLGVM